jgi:uncharacterized protein (DUF4415 family)
MTESKPDTRTEWVDPDDAPEWTEEMFAAAEFRVGGRLIRPATGVLTKDGVRPIGRPPERDAPKQQVTLRLDPDVIERFRAGGPGWQSRMNAALRQAAGLS